MPEKIKTTKKISHNTVTLVLVFGLYAALAALLYSGVLTRQFTNMLVSLSCYVVLAVSLNLVVGLLGELSLGHAGFMSVGLFAGCWLSIKLSSVLPSVVALPISVVFGGLCAAIIGVVVGLPALRLKGDYLAIVTLACGEIIRNIITNIIPKGLNTAGVMMKVPTLFPFAAVLVFITIIVMMNLKKSRHGRAITAIRDNRIAAEAMGLNVTYYKLVVFTLAAFFAGMAGVVYGHSLALSQATSFDYNMSIEILVIVVLGGMGSISGSVIAAIILRMLPELLRGLDNYRMLMYSVLLIVIMLLNASPKFAELKGKFSVTNLIRFICEKNAAKSADNGKDNGKEDAR